MGKELLDYFNFDTNTPTVSAYTQQRAKVLPEAFEYLFKSFTAANIRNTHNYRGFKLIACDGSNLSIAYNPHPLPFKLNCYWVECDLKDLSDDY